MIFDRYTKSLRDSGNMGLDSRKIGQKRRFIRNERESEEGFENVTVVSVIRKNIGVGEVIYEGYGGSGLSLI